MSEPQAATGERVRATTWSEFVGQTQLKRRLQTHIQAARMQGRMLDHMLLIAPPGSGKTTLARLVAEQLGDEFAEYVMPMDPKLLIRLVREWQGGVLLLDEIHRAPKAFQHMLLTVEQGYLETPSGQRLPTRHITFICATTEPQDVIKPLWDRLLLKPTWEDYTDEEMAQIIDGMAQRAGVSIPEGIAEGLARATGGTPRIAGSLVTACRDLQVTGQKPTVETILDQTGVDCDGLSDQHKNYLVTLNALGGQAGLANLSSMLQLSPSVIQDLERLLITRGFIRLESAGRILTISGSAKVPKAPSTGMARRRLEQAS